MITEVIPDVATQIKHIRQSPGRLSRVGAPYFEITLPYDCGIRGVVSRYGKRREAFVESFSVADTLRRNGIGRRLFSLFVVAAKMEEATDLYGDVLSVSMLKTMGSVLGKETLSFAEIPRRYPNGRSKRILLPFDVVANEFAPLRVHARITHVDVLDWERPIE